MGTEMENESQYFKDLYQLASSDRDPEEKIAQAVDIGRERLGLAYGVLSYTGKGEYEVVETNITSGKYTVGSVTNLDETWCRHVVETRESLAFADVDETEYRDDEAREATGLRCYVGSPILVDSETYGTLCYSDETPRETEVTEDEQQFVKLLADWIGHELEREKHYRELRRQNERLDEFTGIVAHDLRNPLAGAIGFTEIALEQTDGKVHDYLRRVENSLNRMDALVGECLMLAKQGTDVGQRTETDLATTVQDAWETVQTGEASLTIDLNKTVYADEARLQRVFENLFRNAVEHCQPDVSVTVSSLPNGFAVSDDGPGLPPAVTQALTDSDEENIKELGLGLLIVERVVSGHNWELAVDSSADGTTFEITGVNTAPPSHQQQVEA